MIFGVYILSVTPEGVVCASGTSSLSKIVHVSIGRREKAPIKSAQQETHLGFSDVRAEGPRRLLGGGTEARAAPPPARRAADAEVSKGRRSEIE